MRDRHRRQGLARAEAEREFLASYARDHLLRHLDNSSRGLWVRTATPLLNSAREIRARFEGVSSDITSFTRALPEVLERLQSIPDSFPKEFQTTEGHPDIAQDTANLRVARLALGTGLFFLIVIIVVNTAMLSQIVRDLGFIPPSLTVLGIPLYFFIAFLLTCVEGGLGVLHAILTDPAEQDRRKLPVGGWLAAVGAVGVACVEGFFYSQIVQDNAATVTIPLVNYTLPQAHLFFLWGFILVMALFGLGLVCFDRGARVLRGTALTTYRKQIRACRKEAARFAGTLQDAEGLVARASDAVVAGQAAPSQFLNEPLERLLREIETLVRSTPEWVKNAQQPLEVHEIRQISRNCLLWLALTLAAGVLSIAIAAFAFSRLVPVESTIALSVGQALFAAIAGFLIGWGETIVQGPDWHKVTSPIWSRFLGVGLTTALGGFHILMLASAQTYRVTLLQVFNLLVCLLVVAACYQLTPLLGLGSIWVQRGLHLVVGAGERSLRGVVLALWLLATLMHYAATILAGPILTIRRDVSKTVSVVGTAGR